MEAVEKIIMNRKLTEAEVDYVLDELAGYDDMRDEETGIQVSLGLFCSSNAVPLTSLRPHSILALREYMSLMG